MIWLQLLGVWGWLKKAALNVFSAAVRYPWQTALIVAVVASCWLWRGKESALRERDAARAQIVALVKASDDNRKAAEEQVRQQQAAFDRAAKEAQNEYQDSLASAHNATDAYIRSHRLPSRQADQCAPASSGKGESPGVPPAMPSDSRMVAVSETDLQSLVDWLNVGVAAHNMAVEKINRGEALPEPALSNGLHN